ncbi:MAG: hypothetical protein ACAI25_18970 [Planctomycetota bacterium]
MASGGRKAAGLALMVCALLAGIEGSRAQDYEPGRDDPKQKNLFRRSSKDPTTRDPQRREAPPSSSTYDEKDEAPPPDAPRPAPGVPGPGMPAQPGDPRPAEGASLIDEIVVKANARARFFTGYDSNVFRAERGRRGDGFFHGYGEAQCLVTFPEERELFASVSGEGISYFKEQAVNETYGSSFVDYYHPLSSVFDIDVQNTFEYSAQNLLDDNGDLLPRAKFNAYDEEARGTVIIHLGPRVSFEVAGGGRYKAFEDNPGLPSLSYWEARGAGAIRYKVWADGRFKLRYVFRDRRYLELPANLRDGSAATNNPKLELQRHQAITTFSQRADLFGMRFVAQLNYTYTYNKDTFQNDRSYQEHSLAGHVEWWPIPTWTALDFDVRGGDRLFLVRRTLRRGDPRFGTHLEQAYCEITIGAWQRLIGPATRGPDGDFANSERGLCVALTFETSYYIYQSTDIRSSYARFIVQGGIEASF